MDPSTLAVVGTNSMLEPIRRAIGKQNLREMLGMSHEYFFDYRLCFTNPTRRTYP